MAPRNNERSGRGAGELPAALGRYVVLGRIGRGGFGVVYQAYDPALDRDVAIKVLAVDGRGAARAAERLRREAAALARLSHPNIVEVYDVGGAQLSPRGDNQGAGPVFFVVMEFVDGQTIRRWLRTERPAQREIVARFLAAAEGLSAAHKAGILHRDVKPGNVMVGNDGRVRVLDFGLALLQGPNPTELETWSQVGEASNQSSDGARITEPGRVVGTVGYIAPEQYRAAPPDERSDQYAFCVALLEALCGQRPVATAAGHEVFTFGGRPQGQEGSRRAVLPWLQQVLLRGLAVDPDDRWPSMDALIAALRRPPGRRRSRVVSAFAGLVGMAAVAGVLAVPARGEMADPCESHRHALADALDPDAVGSMVSELAASQLDPARAEQWLAREVREYEGEWVAAFAQSCDAQALGAAEREVRMLCLDVRRQEVSAWTEVFARSGAALDDAVNGLGALARPLQCLDSDSEVREHAMVPADPRVAAELLDARRLITLADMLGLAGKVVEAEAQAQAAVEKADQVGDPFVRAEARLTLGGQQVESGHPEEAIVTLQAGFWAAQEAGCGPTSVAAAVHLASLESAEGDQAEALRWIGHARTEWERGGRDPAAESLLLEHTAHVYLDAGDFDRGRRLLERSLQLDLADPEIGPHHPNSAASLMSLAGVAARVDDQTATRHYYARALRAYESSLGRTHFLHIYAQVIYGEWLMSIESPEEAAHVCEGLIRDAVAGVEPTHPLLARVHALSGDILLARGESGLALVEHARAYSLFRAAYGDLDETTRRNGRLAGLPVLPRG